MAKKPIRKKNDGAKNPAMTAATKIFAAGAAAEIYLLAIYHYYVRGSISQVLAWHDIYLPMLPWAGLLVLAMGFALMYIGSRENVRKQQAARILIFAGVFVAVTAPMVRAWYTAALTPMCVVAPGLMILGIAWFLYDRECVYALAVLCSAALMLWICRECLPVPVQRLPVRVVAALWLVLAGAAAVLLKKIKADGGVFRKVRILPEKADYMLLYAALGVSAALVLVGMMTPVLAYYAMWAAAAAIFAVAVYYTVQQL